MANPMQNPNDQLEHILRTPATSPNLPITAQHKIYLSKFPPPYPHATSLNDLQYIRLEQFAGRDDELATIQIFQTEDDAYTHWTTLRRLESEIIMRPQQYVYFQSGANKKDFHLLIFEKVIRDSRVWLDAHKKGQVSDEDMWELVKKIVKNLRCLCTEMQPPRAHGNLEKGIGVRSELKVFFYNLGAANTYLKDIQELNGILTKFQQKVGVDVDITKRVSKLKSFLSVSCLAPKPPRVGHSVLYNRFSPDHIMLIFNYPSVWNDEDILRFIANMHKLCSDKCQNNPDSNLLHNYEFRSRFSKSYAHWDVKVKATTSALKEVYQFGAARKSYQRFDRGTHTWVLREASIVTFSHNSVKHACESAQVYNNNINSATPGIQMLPEHVSSEILADIRKEFPFLIEDIYEAFHVALARGYHHHKFTVAEILTGRL